MNDNEIMSLKQGKGMPKITVRQEQNKFLGETLGYTLDGYTMIPVFSYLETTIHDDILFFGCPWAQSKKGSREGVAETYLDI